ncbi:hypothetical protein LguiA_032290 [Lonicera macranthoides]
MLILTSLREVLVTGPKSEKHGKCETGYVINCTGNLINHTVNVLRWLGQPENDQTVLPKRKKDKPRRHRRKWMVQKRKARAGRFLER